MTQLSFDFMQPRFIALYSSEPREGKSEVARILIEKHGFRLVKLADVLKNMTRVFLAGISVPTHALNSFIEGDAKMDDLGTYGLPGVTTRHIMQTLGTEWGRNSVASNLWVDITMRRIAALMQAGEKVVVDDMRFPNEFASLRTIPDSRMIRVRRPLLPDETNVCAPTREEAHVSNGALNDHPFDDVIENAGTLGDLALRVQQIVEATS